MQDPNIFECKIFRESMFLGLNFTLHSHTPVYKYMKYPLGIIQDKHQYAADESTNFKQHLSQKNIAAQRNGSDSVQKRTNLSCELSTKTYGFGDGTKWCKVKLELSAYQA